MNAKELTLRVVPLRDVILHEQIEARRVERLIASLTNDWLLKNPPIVAESEGKCIVLDGATRVTALNRMEVRDVVVQVVDYDAPDLVLETWNHLLVDFPETEFFEALQNIEGLRVEATSIDGAEDALLRRDSVASILLANGQAYSLIGGGNNLTEQAALLNRVVETYDGRGEMYRVAHTNLERLLAEHGQLSALVVFPRFRPADIRHVALNHAKLPMGITRHIIPGRVLRINIPLGLLERDEPLEQKNAWLDEWMRSKMLERHVRYYQEPVFLFDE